MPVEFDYITAFLRRMENPGPDHAPVLRGYVPMSQGQAIGNSGVTIASGLDLGQQSKDGLIKMGIPQTVCAVLFPYVGLKRESAITKLSALPLILSRDAADAVDRAVFRSYLVRAEGMFNRMAGRTTWGGDWKLSDRPKQVQAVVVSLFYQMGESPQKTFGFLASGDYHAAVAELRDPARWGGKYYASRRNAESALIEEVAP